MKDAYVKYSVENKIGTIDFFTPQQNSLPGKTLSDLASIIEEAGKDQNASVLILKSSVNKTFCAGAFLDELIMIENEEQGFRFFNGFATVINAMRRCPKFIIGRIHGKAIGGGVGLAGSCDYSFGTIRSEIKLSELSIGIGPFVVGPAIERKIGAAAAYELTIDATNFRSAEWAKEKGLFAGIFDTEELMDESIDKLANTLAASSPEAMAEIKKSFWHGTEHWNELLQERAAISGRLVLSDHTRKFIQQFKNNK
jgi:methylglutaconyl-CoA hydratase